MKPNNKSSVQNNNTQKNLTQNIKKEITFVFKCSNFSSHKEQLKEIFNKIKPENKSYFEIFVYSKNLNNNDIEQFVANYQNLNIFFIDNLLNLKPKFKLISILDCRLLNNSFDINNLLNIKNISQNIITKLKFVNNDKNLKYSNKKLFIYDFETAFYILKNDIDSENCEYFLKKQNLAIEEISINQKSPFLKENIHKKFKNSITNFLSWYIFQPIKDINKKNITSDIIKNKFEPSIYRLVFFIVALFLMFLMPILSRDAGISGDEKVNYDHAKLVYNYYANGDKSAYDVKVNPNLEKTMLHYYGQSFDNITYIINKITGTSHPYESRHLMNSFLGWLIILITGLFISKIMGWRAAIFGMIFLFLSPRFLGHSFNNPKDIPFALAYIFTIYQVFLFINEMPNYRIKRLINITLGIAMAISVRIGGIMLMAYLFLFVGLAYFLKNSAKDYLNSKFLNKGFRLMAILSIISIIGFYVGIILWPYAIEAPIKHSRESLNIMTNFSVGIRQLFEGNNIWSDKAPWYYLPKYIFMTIPIVVIIGVGLSLIFSKQFVKKNSGIILFIILFSCIFPVFYIIYKKSNVYGGWRHVLFVYPFLVILASIGFESLLRFLKNRYINILSLLVLGFLLFLPLRHISKNHPYEYVYYNEIAGGINKSFGFYEMDYYYHSMREASLWLSQHIKKEHKPQDQKKIVGTNNLGITAYYIQKDSSYLTLEYIRYYERGNYDWDYYIVVNSYIDAFQLQNGIWPPKNTIHTIDVDNKPICAILKRETKNDFIAYQHKLKSENEKDSISERIYNSSKAEEFYLKTIETDPNNEIALLSLTELKMNKNNLDSANIFANMLLKIYPTYENGLNLKGWISLQLFDNTKNQTNLNEAKNAFETITQVNYKYLYGYYGLAMVYIRMNEINRAIKELEKSLKINPGFQQAAQLLNQLKNQNIQR